MKPAQDSEVATAPDAVIKLTGKPNAKNIPVVATGVGGRVVLHNASRQMQDVYGLHETQNVDFSIGEINPGEQGSISVDQPGIYRIFSDIYDQPIAILFVAPARLATSRSINA